VQPFGVNTEQSTEWGLVGALGGELPAALGIQLGYRIFL
jgi:hypothetical protein